MNSYTINRELAKMEEAFNEGRWVDVLFSADTIIQEIEAKPRPLPKIKAFDADFTDEQKSTLLKMINNLQDHAYRGQWVDFLILMETFLTSFGKKLIVSPEKEKRPKHVVHDDEVSD